MTKDKLPWDTIEDYSVCEHNSPIRTNYLAIPKSHALALRELCEMATKLVGNTPEGGYDVVQIVNTQRMAAKLWREIFNGGGE